MTFVAVLDDLPVLGGLRGLPSLQANLPATAAVLYGLAYPLSPKIITNVPSEIDQIHDIPAPSHLVLRKRLSPLLVRKKPATKSSFIVKLISCCTSTTYFIPAGNSSPFSHVIDFVSNYAPLSAVGPILCNQMKASAKGRIGLNSKALLYSYIMRLHHLLGGLADLGNDITLSYPLPILQPLIDGDLHLLRAWG